MPSSSKHRISIYLEDVLLLGLAGAQRQYVEFLVRSKHSQIRPKHNARCLLLKVRNLPCAACQVGLIWVECWSAIECNAM